jgi:hypothetical protein
MHCCSLFFSNKRDLRGVFVEKMGALHNTLSQIISEQKRKPIAIRLDNGSEFTSCEFTNWAKKTI